MELFWFFCMGIWNSRSDILTFRRKGKKVLIRCSSILREVLISWSLPRERHMAIWYDTGPYQVVLPPLLRVPLPPVLLRFGGGYYHFTGFFLGAFLTSAEVASTEHWVACSLSCPGYLCRYRDIFALGLGFCCTSIEVQVIIFFNLFILFYFF